MSADTLFRQSRTRRLLQAAAQVWCALTGITLCLATLPTAKAQDRVGPSFRCDGKATANQPLAQLICLNDQLAYSDLAYVIAYQALHGSLDEPGRRALATEAGAFVLDTADACRVPRSGFLGRTPTQAEITCIKEHFDRQRAALAARARGPAAEEANLRPEEVLSIQHGLQTKGLLPSTARLDGVLGPASRAAIETWQRVVGLPVTAFASKYMASRLAAPAHVPPPVAPSASPPLTPRQVSPTKFGSCESILESQPFQLPSGDFESSRPIFGTPGSQWTFDLLDEFLIWARACLVEAKPTTASNAFKTEFGHLKSFEWTARTGIRRRLESDEVRRVYQEAMTAPTSLPNGGTVSCFELTRFSRPSGLDDSIFGRSYRTFTAADFEAITAKVKACDAAFAAIRTPSNSAGFAASSDLRELQFQQQSMAQEEASRRQMEKFMRDMADPAKRARLEAEAAKQEAERQQGAMAKDEADIRAALAGKPVRRPNSTASEQVIYCGGYFSTPRARQALVRADILPSAEQAMFAAIGISANAGAWLDNRAEVLGKDAVIRDLLPVRDAGQTAGLSATPETAGKLFPTCKDALERLAAELQRRRR